MANWLSKSPSIDFINDQYYNDANESVSPKKNYHLWVLIIIDSIIYQIVGIIV